VEIKIRFVKGSLLGEFVYRTLREAIVRGVLPEGRGVQDRVLALGLGVSRTPVREALQRLEAEGFLEKSF
jgi:DNA-binding GntR family transcriptional regulator